ncbi:MAG: heparinase II/III-family protein, partial [Gemmatimonadota bacterium]|nr:heparinase II/III-family protein [Gemmatimonadota bacterium]
MNGSALLRFDLAERRKLAATSFAPLVQALRAELEPMFNGPLPIPSQKARLTRVGGRCSMDGTLLAFDPWSPTEHHCPGCQRVFMGPEHNDWWAMGAQLWVAERAVQSAALHLLTGDGACETLALRIVIELSERYASYPNRDNALGPTRPFFSTYLESIWLLNICHAIALLEASNVQPAALDKLQRVRAALVRPSRDLIASFDEGRSNRQVWNEVAILSASCLLGDAATVKRRLQSTSGLRDHFEHGLLADGTWYEGENYHLFAHRGLWYGVQLLRALDRPLQASHERRFRAGFVAPFLGLLPDLTLPSRRDSQYKVSIRQWRFAEWCELGVAHESHQLMVNDPEPDTRLSAILHRLYERDGLNDQQRHRVSTADAERNEPAGTLSRASLSWRTLLMATAELPPRTEWQPTSICLPQQGLAVLRRDLGHMYVALEGGHTGGGHGHPDRLALTLQYDDKRWLQDSGTGSYVEKKLHWYRSTLAHFAPLVNGASQNAVPAELVAYEDRGGAGWICKRVKGLARGVNMQRTVVVADGYLIDFLEWEADHDCQVELPLARQLAVVNGAGWVDATAGGAGGLEDGFDFLTDVAFATIGNSELMFQPKPAVPEISACYSIPPGATWWRATAPLPQGHG